MLEQTVETPALAVSRPRAVTLAAVAHWLIALAFLSIPLVGLVYGAGVQAAAEAEAARQGVPASALAEHGIAFQESGVAIAVPVILALAVAALGLAVRAGKRAARILAWIVMPLVLLGNVAILASNAGAAAALRQILDASGDERLRGLDAQALLDAAFAAYPDWLPLLTGTRNVVVFAGAVAAVVLLTLPAARTYFRKR